MTVQKKRSAAFVDYVINRVKIDNAFGSGMRRSNNPATEHAGWQSLVIFGINLKYEGLRKGYLLVGSEIAKRKPDGNGSLKFGRAFAMCFNDGSESVQAQSKMKRLLACAEQAEAALIMTSMLSLIASKQKNAVLDYYSLISQIEGFYWDPERSKAEWATEFYSTNYDKSVDLDTGELYE